MTDHMKAPCAHCPFRNDLTPFLHPDRADEIATLSTNRFADFLCHKTVEHNEDDGEAEPIPDSKTCAGFLAMQINEAGVLEPEGWVWPNNVYVDPMDMYQAYKAAWDDKTQKAMAIDTDTPVVSESPATT